MPPLAGTVPLLTDYLSLGFNQGEDDTKWRKLTVSRLNYPKWLTIPWDVEYADPKNQHGAGGWSILQGPCTYMLRVHARLKGLEPSCSVHVQGVTVTKDPDTGTQTIVALDEGIERPVLAYETSHTHVDGELFGVLAAGQYLQVRLDYWNAGRNPDGTFDPQTSVYGWLVGASVRGCWGPAPEALGQ